MENEYFDELAKTWDDNPQVVERAWIVSEAIIESVPLDTTMNCLEIGAGTGRIAFQLAPWVGAILLADGSAQMVATARRRIEEAKVENMLAEHFEFGTDRFPQGDFSLVYSSMAFHHLPDIAGLLKTIAMHQQPHAYLCIIDLVTEDGSFHAHAPELPVHRGFDQDLLGKQVETAGYRVVGNEVFHTIERLKGDGTAMSYPLFMITAIRT